MTNKILGAIAMACAPFLCIDFLVHGQAGPNENFEHTSLSGLFSLVYMIGWMCSIVVLQRVAATGVSRFGRIILYVQLGTLMLANVWNVAQIIVPGSPSKLLFVLDFFWPISQLVLLIIGITVLTVRSPRPGRGGLAGWRRFVPLMAGLWFPVSIVLMGVIGQNFTTMIISGSYSAVMWGLMGWVCYNTPGGEFFLRRWMSIGAVL